MFWRCGRAAREITDDRVGAMSEINPDEIFAEVALEMGLLSEKQIQECNKIRDELHGMGLTVRSMEQIAVERKFITGDQRKQIRQQMVERGVYPRLGGYELLAKAGSGGMGAVYKARQLSLDRVVAIKVLPPELARDMNYVKRFKREAKLAAKISHPNAVHVYDVGYEKGKHFIAMEYVPGLTMNEVLAKGPLEEQRALEIVRQVASALGEAHRRNIIHRDIKPGNILLTREGTAKVSDLGLAKDIASTSEASLTVSGLVTGTPNYMSPEQCCGDRDIDHRTDIYSLGITLYRMITGTEPFEATTPVAVMQKHMDEPLPDPRSSEASISEATVQLIRDMTAKDRERRVQSCEDVIRRIDEATSGTAQVPMGAAQPTVPTPAPPPVGIPVGPRSWSRIALWAGGAVLALAVLAVGAFVVFGGGGDDGGGEGPPTTAGPDEPDQPPPPDESEPESDPALAAAAQEAIRTARKFEEERDLRKAVQILMLAWQNDQQNEDLIREVMRIRRKLKPLMAARLMKEPCEIALRAYISGESALLLRDGMIEWRHGEGDLPGKEGGNDYPTYVNGRPWRPQWLPERTSEGQVRSTICLCPELIVPQRSIETRLVEWEGPEKRIRRRSPSKPSIGALPCCSDTRARTPRGMKRAWPWDRRTGWGEACGRTGEAHGRSARRAGSTGAESGTGSNGERRPRRRESRRYSIGRGTGMGRGGGSGCGGRTMITSCGNRHACSATSPYTRAEPVTPAPPALSSRPAPGPGFHE